MSGFLAFVSLSLQFYYLTSFFSNSQVQRIAEARNKKAQQFGGKVNNNHMHFVVLFILQI